MCRNFNHIFKWSSSTFLAKKKNNMLLNELEIRLYLTRIGAEQSFSQCQLPTIEWLSELHRSHLLSVPFENLSVTLNQPILLGDKHAYNKIVVNNRGGFCYELNYAFYQLLVSMHFNVSLLSAQVYNADTQQFGLPYDHLVLLVNVQGQQYLVDVGFGDCFVEPISMNGEMQQQSNGEYRITYEGKQYFLHQRKSRQNWQLLYQFELSPCKIGEFYDMCHYHQHNVASTFTQKSLCTRLTDYGRVTLANGKLIRTEYGQKSEVSLTTEEQLKQVLAQEFAICFNAKQQLTALMPETVLN